MTTSSRPETRTTSEPSVLATSASSTSASCVFVPVPLLPTAVSGPAASSAPAVERSAYIRIGPPPMPYGPT